VSIALDWLRGGAGAPALRRGALAFAAAAAVVMLAAAWPTLSTSFSDSALAHVRPGGGLVGAVRRLVHPPAIDPRTPVAQGLLNAYMPGARVPVLLADAPDLAIEALMHARRADAISIGDTGMDSYVPADWTGRIGAELASLPAGARLLTDTSTLALARTIADQPRLRPLGRPLSPGGDQMEWILQRLVRRFRLRPIVTVPYGLIVAELVPR
jgi:hypothetical protein